MEHLTYHQVLADHYEETGKTAFVVAQEYEDDVEPHEKKEHVELENQEEFQKFIPRHDLSTLTKPHSESDKHTTSVQYNRQTQVRLINIDSRFRIPYNDPTALKETFNFSNISSSNFVFRLRDPIKNVISVRLSSIEIPNSFYTFSAIRGNISFEMTYNNVTELIQINPGNWKSINNTEQTSILYQVETAINEKFNTTLFRVEYINPSTGKIRITNSTFSTTTPETSSPFSINFRINNSRAADFGLGYNLGFRQSAYFNTNTINAEAILNTIDTNYLFLTLDPDWKVIEHETPDRTQLFSFAKVVIDQPKFDVVYDNGQNTLTKEYFLKQPTNIHTIPVRVSDPYDQDIDLNGLDFSFTLELTEVLNSGLYESMRS
jgi:hypothetical protein